MGTQSTISSSGRWRNYALGPNFCLSAFSSHGPQNGNIQRLSLSSGEWVLGQRGPPQKKTSSPLGSHLHGLFLFFRRAPLGKLKGESRRGWLYVLFSAPPAFFFFFLGGWWEGGGDPIREENCWDSKGSEAGGRSGVKGCPWLHPLRRGARTYTTALLL